MRYDDPHWYDQSEQNNQPLSQPDPALPIVPEQEIVDQNATTPVPEDGRRHSGQRIFGQVVMTLAFMILAFLAGWFANQIYTNARYTNDQSLKYANLFQQAWSVVDQNYVDRKSVNYQQMSYDAIKAMLNDLGDNGHTRFMTPQDVKAEQQQLSGTFAGIGVYISQDAQTKAITITSVIPDTPAAQSGLKSGDVITAVNGTNVEGMDFNSKVQPMIEGPAGTQVSITIKRPSTGETLTFKMTRATIKVPNVTMHYIAEDHVADIQIVQFSDGVSDQLKTAILQAKKDGATKLILDLRNNPGGYLQQAIDTASEFMASGTVLIEQDSSGNQTKMNVTGNTVDTGIPMVVLINGNTASAAEIVSGALRDNGRAVIMGTASFGTGTVLNEYDLSDGSAILLGTQEWLTPKGHFIRKDKIQPDIKVEIDPKVSIITPDVANQNHMSLDDIKKSGDVQLIQAIQYLDSH